MSEKIRFECKCSCVPIYHRKLYNSYIKSKLGEAVTIASKELNVFKLLCVTSCVLDKDLLPEI